MASVVGHRPAPRPVTKRGHATVVFYQPPRAGSCLIRKVDESFERELTSELISARGRRGELRPWLLRIPP
jgi:hypothetical protein